MRHEQIQNTLFIKNRRKTALAMAQNSCAIINSSDEMPKNGDQNFRYRQNSNMLYLTGIHQERTVLLLCPEHLNPDYREILFIRKADKTLEIWEGHKYTKSEASEISGVKNVKWLSAFESTLNEIMFQTDNLYLVSNENYRYSTEVPTRDSRFIETMKKQFPLHNFKRLSPILTNLRLQKESEEIEQMQKACDITTGTFHKLLKFIKPGVKEYEIEAEIIAEFIRNGAEGHAYEPIVASGKNNCVLHYIDNDQTCKEGDLVLMDFGAEYAGYAADTTRTVPVSGKFSPRQREVYDAVLRVMKAATLLIKVGTTINKINIEVRELIENELISLKLITPEQIANQAKDAPVRAKYFMHGNSHFMGLDVHDVGFLNTPLMPGMVLSCEPGIYIEEEGFGIRLENDILVTETGQIDLLANEPVEADDIERLMAEK